jgi:hypothetical protein
MQLYAILRGAIFAESGYNLAFSQIAPDGLKRSDNAMFATMDRNGKTVRLDRVGGTEGNGDDVTVAIPLTPYPDAKAAGEALALICSVLVEAREGDAEAKTVLGAAWNQLLFQGLAIESQSGKTQLAILENQYGKARVHEQLNRFGTVKGLGVPDYALMVSEALPA